MRRWKGRRAGVLAAVCGALVLAGLAGYSCTRTPPREPPLPDLAGANRVYVCEGEKAADAVRSIGLTATTSAHGCESPGKADWGPLAGKEIIILPDNDSPGGKYADAVAALLAALPWPWRAGRWLAVRGLADVGDLAYRAVARNRQAISLRLGLAACGTGLAPTGPRVPAEGATPPRPRSVIGPGLLLAVMLIHAYNANLADRFTRGPLPEPPRLQAAVQLALFDQEWDELPMPAGPATR